MKTLKQIKEDPRVYEVTQNPEWSPELAADYPDNTLSRRKEYE